ncbi:MAG: porin family protein, partial [Gemmatimonadaceae bacterium]
AVTIGILMTMAGASAAQTQMSSGTRFMIGPFVGVNYTTLSRSEVQDASYRTGFAAGGQLQADFSDGLFFRTALLYSQRGAEATVDATKVTLKESYVEVPLLLGYSFAMANSSTKPFIMAGGQVGAKVSCDLRGTQAGTTLKFKCDDPDVDIQPKTFDYGAVGGAGVMFSAAGGTMSIDARYYLGLADVTETSNGKHRGFTAGIAYMIPIGH